MALSSKTIQIVKATAPVVGENAKKITAAFYPTLFKNNPEALHYFNKTNQSKGMQQQALADAVVAYATNVDNLGVLTGAVNKIAHRHVALSITPDLYQIVHDNLMLAIGEVLGDAVTPEIGGAWSEAVMALAKICIDTEEGLYKQVESRKGGWRGERKFILTKKTEKAKDVVAFDFTAADGYSGGFEFEPGQYLTIRIDGIAPRHYTITSVNGESSLQCTTRLLDGGDVSTYMHKSMKEGEECLLAPPCGVFTPQPGSENVALISAGIGITPMWSFLNHFGQDRVKLALHVEESPERHAYKSEFEKSGVNCKWVYTKNDGRPDLSKEAASAIATSGENAAFYICGPNPFMDGMASSLKQHGASKVFMEKFGTG